MRHRSGELWSRVQNCQIKKDYRYFNIQTNFVKRFLVLQPLHGILRTPRHVCTLKINQLDQLSKNSYLKEIICGHPDEIRMHVCTTALSNRSIDGSNGANSTTLNVFRPLGWSRVYMQRARSTKRQGIKEKIKSSISHHSTFVARLMDEFAFVGAKDFMMKKVSVAMDTSGATRVARYKHIFEAFLFDNWLDRVYAVLYF
jgi:hypothetical protein